MDCFAATPAQIVLNGREVADGESAVLQWGFFIKVLCVKLASQKDLLFTGEIASADLFRKREEPLGLELES